MEEKNNSCCKGSNGFLFGMIVGGALVFLIGTKKGRKVLKELSLKGADMIEGLSSIEDTESLSEEEDDGAVYEEQIDREVEKEKSETKPNPSRNGHTFGKRFFKGIKRK